MGETYYFISAFLEVESIVQGNNIIRELNKCGNLFASEEEAHKALGKIKIALANE